VVDIFVIKKIYSSRKAIAQNLINHFLFRLYSDRSVVTTVLRIILNLTIAKFVPLFRDSRVAYFEAPFAD
jgi:hypothetical protein